MAPGGRVLGLPCGRLPCCMKVAFPDERRCVQQEGKGKEGEKRRKEKERKK